MCNRKLEMAACARSRLLAGNPTRKIERPTRVPWNAFQIRVSMSHHQVLVVLDWLGGVDDQMPVPAERQFKPRQRRRGRSAHHRAARVEHAAMAGTMKTFAGKVDGATQMSAHRRDGAKLLAITEHEDPQVGQESRAFRIILRLQSLETAAGLIKHIGDEKTARSGQGRTQREERRAPAERQRQKRSPLQFVIWWLSHAMSP